MEKHIGGDEEVDDNKWVSCEADQLAYDERPATIKAIKESYSNYIDRITHWSNMEYIIERPKTESGTRFVPMTKDVADSFRNIIDRKENSKIEPIVDDVVGFLCLDKMH